VELHLINNSIIVSSVTGVEKLQLLYDKVPVASVAKLDFRLVNSGRTPIRASDIVATPGIQFENSMVLDARLQRLDPPDVQASLAMDTTARSVGVTFPLLNPGDAISFSVLVAGPTWGNRVFGRIAGVSSISFVDDRISTGGKESRLSASFYIVAAFTAITFVLFLSLLYVAGAEQAIKEQWNRGSIVLPRMQTAADYLSFCDRTIPAEKSSETVALRSHLRGLPQDHIVTDEDHARVVEQLGAALMNVKGIKSATLLMLLFSVIGAVFVLRELI
jgi:hypothetical protein